ncbi:MAG: hypothetical protein MUO94_03295 [Thermoplasmata archaeon]|nr:hypothetical protein [Thermoplasmata archaeon]
MPASAEGKHTKEGNRGGSLTSDRGFYGANHTRPVPKRVPRRTPGSRYVQKRTLLTAVAVGIALSFALSALNGLSLPSLWGSEEHPDPSEHAEARDWPADYLNGTVTQVGAIHSDFSTYEDLDITVQGNVTAAPAEYEGGYFFIQDSTGGIAVNISGSGFVFALSRGDFVRLNGTVGVTVEGMHTIEDSRSYWLMSIGNPVEVQHLYNSSLVAPSHQGMLVKMNGYLTNFTYDNTSHTAPDWERVVCTSTLWMYNRTFMLQATNITLSDYDGFAMVTGVMFYDDGTYTLRPRSTSDIEQGSGPYRTPDIDGYIADWYQSETAVDDSDSDSGFAGNEFRCLSVTWDADFLHVAIDYTIMTGYSVIVYIDAMPVLGATNVSAFYDYSSWSRHVDFADGFDADIIICRLGVATPVLLRATDNAVVTDISGVWAAMGPGVADGSGAAIEAAIPWTQICGLDPGEVPPGMTIRMVGVITGDANTNVFDSAPDSPLPFASVYNRWAHLVYYYDFCVDCDTDGIPDDYSSGFAIPEFSILIVVPMMVAVMLVVRSRRKKT